MFAEKVSSGVLLSGYATHKLSFSVNHEDCGVLADVQLEALVTKVMGKEKPFVDKGVNFLS